MKKTVFCLCILFAVLINMTSCDSSEKIVSSLGSYDRMESYSRGDYQDYTDYQKYYFSEVSPEDNPYFESVGERDTSDLYACLDDFENLIRYYAEEDPTQELVLHYDFDRSVIDFQDYFYLECQKAPVDDEVVILTSYDLYILDVQTSTLYYFHDNI